MQISVCAEAIGRLRHDKNFILCSARPTDIVCNPVPAGHNVDLLRHSRRQVQTLSVTHCLTRSLGQSRPIIMILLVTHDSRAARLRLTGRAANSVELDSDPA